MRLSEQRTRLRQAASARMPTRWGALRVLGFEREAQDGRIDTALAIVRGGVRDGAPLVRIHSECFTSEVLKSLRCDCSDQLDIAMSAIAAEERGVVIYERQEGRGIGLMAKLQAYALQDAGLDTIDANHALGYASDSRDFTMSAAILRTLGVRRVRLLTNNPQKTRALRQGGVDVVAEIPCEVAPNAHSRAYLETKRERMGHTLKLCQSVSALSD